MSFEAILGFIAIAVISSFFNKSKEAKTRRTGPSQGQSRPNTRPAQSKPQPATRQGQRRPSTGPTGGLGDLFRDFQKDLNEVFGEATRTGGTARKSQQYSQMEEESPEKQPEIVEKSKILKTERTVKTKKSDTRKDVIQAGEISAQDLISIDQKSILQGVIMSEVLGKPKAKQR
ncbi:hypothetical protein Amet_3036 [Alkaliphilus metalliredigens QYMF]|uniref:Uncharacterized protein n=1 Tax=Alkaliphilus metalliredigens (strain QYMF) TaxID=293826 RepID=A6TSK8_ALKMQ|nr:hypothetical protein [Alkaliphilus metalliredigens]ABR49176.1 hypothetical protein Amet_3036 [Alkaliphilus metalliredigens QYMF]